MSEKIGTAQLSDRIGATKRAIDELDKALNYGSVSVYWGQNQGFIKVPKKFSNPVILAIQAVLKQGMTLDTAVLSEMVGLPYPKITEDQQEVKIRLAQKALNAAPDETKQLKEGDDGEGKK